VISGSVQAHGDIKTPGTKGIQAGAHLAITPGRRSTPVSGRLNADYNGASDTVSVGDSYIALPNSRLDLSGSLDHRLNLKLVSTNLNDFQPVLKQPLPVKLNNGSVSFTGAVTGKLAAPQITGHLQAVNFILEDRPFDRLAADLSASANSVRIDNGSLSHAATQLEFSGSAGLHKWSPENYEPLNVNATIRNADVADLLAIAGQKDVPASGTLNANAQITGTIGNPRRAYRSRRRQRRFRRPVGACDQHSNRGRNGPHRYQRHVSASPGQLLHRHDSGACGQQHDAARPIQRRP
jgi:translocation and assembly module TamB